MEARELVQRHPHATKKYFDECKGKNNTNYIADKYLFDNSKKYSGCGYFPKLSENLLLTATESAQRHCNDSWIPSCWKMPPGFISKTCHSYLWDEAKWFPSEDGSHMAIHQGFGQEFVFDKSDEFYQWFNDKLLPEMRK